MVCFQVSSQLVIQLVYSSALHASVRLLFVGLLVLQELGALLEFLAALRALVCSVCVVRLHVDVERVLSRERLFAN